MKTFAIQFSNYNFQSSVLFVEATTEKEAIEKASTYTLPHRFVFERFLSQKEMAAYSQEEMIFVEN